MRSPCSVQVSRQCCRCCGCGSCEPYAGCRCGDGDPKLWTGWLTSSARPGWRLGPRDAACVIATTAAREPLPAELFRAAVHVTGIGTDMPGKGELPVEVFAGAVVTTDDHGQCLDHGDFGNAVR